MDRTNQTLSAGFSAFGGSIALVVVVIDVGLSGLQIGGDYEGVGLKGRRGTTGVGVTNRDKHHISIDRNCNATTPADSTPALAGLPSGEVVMRSSRRRVPSTASSRQGLGSGKTNRDLSVTQFALMDDENVSATQQVTRGGGGLTLVSQWKSQFDDSEETTDNEWKGENMPSPEHKLALSNALLLNIDVSIDLTTKQQRFSYNLREAGHARDNFGPNLSSASGNNNAILVNPGAGTSALAAQNAHSRLRCLNIAGIESFPDLQPLLPRAWSLPQIGDNVREGLEPPLLQQAAFDDTLYTVDVMRNVATRRTEPRSFERKKSLPVCYYVLLVFLSV
ncbi:unnamed protein product [Nesidiocoris tenuis]|uniref:Uncharacterized protein n=1 Tax=Nesidiocoris tenuis TaxID=355587 RepID=A0A6H5G247_9HEMI|nr:unnamed protein product [Nesidiocoris tenuis]